jgi:hypothetical protein
MVLECILYSPSVSKELLLEKWLPPGPRVEVALLFMVSLKCLCFSFCRMPDPDFTVRDVKLLVGKLFAVCMAQRR